MTIFSPRMLWSAGPIQSGYWKIHPYLPSSLRTNLDGFLFMRSIDDKHLEKLEILGKSIGLKKNEVSAAFNPPLNMTHWRSRLTPFSTCVMLLAIALVSFLILILASPNNPVYGPPTSTYVFGTRYGTIRPDCFPSSTPGSTDLSRNESEFTKEVFQ